MPKSPAVCLPTPNGALGRAGFPVGGFRSLPSGLQRAAHVPGACITVCGSRSINTGHTVLEQRFLTFGVIGDGRLVVVAHIERYGRIRINSARQMTPQECRQYEQF